MATLNKDVEEATIRQFLALLLPNAAEEGDIRGRRNRGCKALIDRMVPHMGRAETSSQSEILIKRLNMNLINYIKIAKTLR